MVDDMTKDDKWGSEWPEMLGVAINPKQSWADVEVNTRWDKQFKSQGSNLVDTEAYLYFQCDGCGAILDPNTKSFKTLQDKRAEAGWACKWNIDGMGYKVYCAECGKKK